MNFLMKTHTQEETLETKVQPSLTACLLLSNFTSGLFFSLLLKCLDWFCTECLYVYLGHREAKPVLSWVSPAHGKGNVWPTPFRGSTLVSVLRPFASMSVRVL